MKWKDTGEMANKEEPVKEEEYFDEEQYSPWADGGDTKKRSALNRIPVLFVLLVAAIVALVVTLLMLVMDGSGGALSPQQMASFDERLLKLEERLDKFEAIDEKVTRIWEQAKSFEKFKDRFDRSEASMSLRMDHLTMSLETMQKQFSESQDAMATSPAQVSSDKMKAPVAARYHQVQAGDTFYNISKKYEISVDQLLKLNQMKPGSVIQPGQKLIVRQPSK